MGLWTKAVLLAWLAGGWAWLADAQAPGLLWSTNVLGSDAWPWNARLFTVDDQTNAYASNGGAVVVLSPAGVPLRTNAICPVGDLALRDGEGNFYFSGSFKAPQDFGGITLTQGRCFLAKYTGSGALLWATGFGPAYVHDRLTLDDLRFDSSGSVYLAYTWNEDTMSHKSLLACYSPSGSNVWSTSLGWFGGSIGGTSQLGGITSSNGYLLHVTSGYVCYSYRFSSEGVISSWGGEAWQGRSPFRQFPVRNSAGELYLVEDYNAVLVKRDPLGTLLWSVACDLKARTVGPDRYDGVHVASDDGKFRRYDADGGLAWTMSLPSPCQGMLLDPQGNRFLWLRDGTIARLGAELVRAPVFTISPQGQTVLAGSNVVFTAQVSGSGPLRYYWLHNGAASAETMSSSLILSNVTPAAAGEYLIVASNFLGSATSAPALLRVKSVALFSGDQLLTNGTYVFATPPVLTVRSAFTGGSSFYTLDGSLPSFASTHYTAPFTLQQSATVRAIGYTADFQQSEEADSVDVVVLERHTLTATSPGGGSVSLNPSLDSYFPTNLVTATAMPAPGWSFLYWLGDATGADPVVQLSMERDKTIQAVFGTTLTTTVAGNGQVLLDPPGGLYPYGSTVRLTGVPQPGNYFGFWGNAAAGNSNPISFTIISPTQTVSSILAATPTGQAALTVLSQGAGRVNVSPVANAHPLGQTVSLTATPDPGQRFLYWSGDASGTQNPLGITMTQAKVITATFSSGAELSCTRPGLEGYSTAGFRFTLISEPQTRWEIFGSANLNAWESLGFLTNTFGEGQFTDPAAASLPRRSYRAELRP